MEGTPKETENALLKQSEGIDLNKLLLGRANQIPASFKRPRNDVEEPNFRSERLSVNYENMRSSFVISDAD